MMYLIIYLILSFIWSCWKIITIGFKECTTITSLMILFITSFAFFPIEFIWYVKMKITP